MKILLTIWALFVFTSVHAKQIIVSPSGSDNNSGTISSPIKTLNRAWELIAAGDTVYLRGGTYGFNSTQYLEGKNGTAAKLILVTSYPGEKAILSRGSNYNTSQSHELIYFTGNYFHFLNFEIANFSQRQGDYAYSAFRANPANNCTWERIYYHHNGSGFSLKGNSSNNTFLNCDFSHNQDPFSSSPYDGADGLDLHELSGNNNKIKGCRSFWNADDGFDLWENHGYVLIEDSWAFYNGYIPGTFTEAGNGTGFKLGSGPTTSANLRDVKNCIAYKNFNYGIIENSAPCGMTITNNTSFGNGKIAYWWSWTGGKAVLTNNIAYGSPQAHRMSENDVMTNNSWQGRTANTDDFESLDDSQLQAPRKADGSLPNLTFLKVKPGSDLVGLGARFEGTVTPPPPTVTLLFTLHVYTDGTAFKAVKPKKTLLCDVEFYSDGTIIKK